METLDDKVIVKNALEPKAESVILEFASRAFPSRKTLSRAVVIAYHRHLTKQFGQRGDEIGTALMEALINYFDHANHHDPNKKVYVNGWRTPSRVYFTIGGESETGFDPTKVCLSGEDRNRAGLTRRGRGHIIMQTYADYIQYDADGKSMMLAFDLEKKVA